MKAILVLEEMPSKCNKCPMSRFVSEFSEDNNSIYCVFNRYIGAKYKSTEWDADRPSWCPLKKMPTLTDEERECIDESWVKGFDWVIEEIER